MVQPSSDGRTGAPWNYWKNLGRDWGMSNEFSRDSLRVLRLLRVCLSLPIFQDGWGRHWFTGSLALPGNPLRGRLCLANLFGDQPGTRGRASKAVRSQAEPGNEEKIGWRDGFQALWCIVRYGLAD
jgi:hypothetical protein